MVVNPLSMKVKVTTVATTGTALTVGYVRVVEAKEYPQADLHTPRLFRTKCTPPEADEDDDDEEEDDDVDPEDEEVVECEELDVVEELDVEDREVVVDDPDVVDVVPCVVDVVDTLVVLWPVELWLVVELDPGVEIWVVAPANAANPACATRSPRRAVCDKSFIVVVCDHDRTSVRCCRGFEKRTMSQRDRTRADQQGRE